MHCREGIFTRSWSARRVHFTARCAAHPSLAAGVLGDALIGAVPVPHSTIHDPSIALRGVGAAESLQLMSRSNLLINGLSQKNRLLLLSMSDEQRLSPGEVLFERGQDAASILFPSSGAVAMIVPSHATSGLSVLLVGREGMLGTHDVLADSQTALRAVVLLPGQAIRIAAVDFRRALDTSPDLRHYLLGYVGRGLNQIAMAGVRARFCTIGARLAGWLLMFRDRSDSDSFRLTQASLALVLGVRREAVSAAAGPLQQQKLIAYRRGELTVLDAVGLRHVAGQVDRVE